VFPKRCKGLVGGSLNPNVPPPNNTALGEADQSPAGLHRLKEFYPGHAIDGRVYAREPDDTPTRIVRREDLPPDAA